MLSYLWSPSYAIPKEYMRTTILSPRSIRTSEEAIVLCIFLGFICGLKFSKTEHATFGRLLLTPKTPQYHRITEHCGTMEYPACYLGVRLNKSNDRWRVFLYNLISDPLAPASISIKEKDTTSFTIQWEYNRERSYVRGWKVCTVVF